MKAKTFPIKTSIAEGEKMIDALCLAGGEIYALKLMVKQKQGNKIKLSDLKKLHRHLVKADKIFQKYWKQMLDTLPTVKVVENKR